MTGLVTVAFIAFDYGRSALKLSESIDDLTASIGKLSDASTLSQFLGVINDGLDVLTPAAFCFNNATDQATDEEHNLNLFKVYSITDCLSNINKAQYDMSAAIDASLKGIPAESSTDLDELAGKIEKAAVAVQGQADVADNVHGITGLFFGVAAFALSVDSGLEKLSNSLDNLANAIGALHDPAFDRLVEALKHLAESEGNVQEAFIRLGSLF